MFALLRFAVPLMIVLTIVYVGLSLYSRNVRRGKLEAHWDRKKLTGNRDAFIKLGLRKYDGSIRRKLIWGVYIVPVAVVMLLVYVTNHM